MIKLSPDSLPKNYPMVSFSFAGKQYQTGRVIGNEGNDDGPTIVFTGGMHGNEPTGVIAIQQVFQELAEWKIQLNGRMIGLVGNLNALKNNARYASEDLNRVWNQAFLDRWRQRTQGLVSEPVVDESNEQLELFAEIEPLLQSPLYQREKKTPPKLYFADLHTTSSESIPFIGINDQIDNRRYALKFPVCTVLGIEEYLEGPLLSMLNDEGHVAMAFEAGQHEDPQSLERHKSFVYLALFNAGLLGNEHAVLIGQHRKNLAESNTANQGIVEVVYRKPVVPEDQFAMKPGFANFSKIKKGEELANDRNGIIRAHRSGQIFMPLYQSTGNDGFFIVRGVPGWALSLSRFLRRINFERILVLLPGISRSKTQSDALVVNKKIARFLAVELFHLLGYRRKKDDGNEMIVSRREIVKS